MMIPNSKTLYLHIGYPKTGTTSIQLGLYRAHHKLASMGYYFPETRDEGIGKLSLHRWIRHFVRNHVSDQDIRKLIYNLQRLPQHRIILSAEEISDFNEDEILCFAEMFSMFDIYIIVYLRRQDLYLQSLWSQFVKMGKTALPFAEWTHETLTTHNNTPFTPHYDRIIDLWSNVFGESRIKIRPFEQTQLHDSLLFDFLQTSDVSDLSGFDNVSVQNSSPGIKTLEILRHITASLGIHDGVHNESRRRILYRELNNMATEMGWNNGKPNLLTNQLHMDIMSVFEEGNCKLAQIYLSQPRLFIEPFQERDFSLYNQQELSEHHLLRYLTVAFEKVSPNSTLNDDPITYDSLLSQIRIWLSSSNE